VGGLRCEGLTRHFSCCWPLRLRSWPVPSPGPRPIHRPKRNDRRANFKIEMPASWNGTLVLYSHGYVTPGNALVARDAGDPITAAWLLANGLRDRGLFVQPERLGLQQAFHDQIALLGHFQDEHGKPARTIAWGHSLGGIITAGLIQLHPERFAGAIPMCGVVAGGVGVWNQGLDAQFVLQDPGAGARRGRSPAREHHQHRIRERQQLCAL